MGYRQEAVGHQLETDPVPHRPHPTHLTQVLEDGAGPFDGVVLARGEQHQAARLHGREAAQDRGFDEARTPRRARLGQLHMDVGAGGGEVDEDTLAGGGERSRLTEVHVGYRLRSGEDAQNDGGRAGRVAGAPRDGPHARPLRRRRRAVPQVDHVALLVQAARHRRPIFPVPNTATTLLAFAA